MSIRKTNWTLKDIPKDIEQIVYNEQAEYLRHHHRRKSIREIIFSFIRKHSKNENNATA